LATLLSYESTRLATASTTEEWIPELTEKIKARLNQPSTKKEEDTSNRRAFVHIQYHPEGLEQKQVRDAFNETCNNFSGTAIEVNQLTVALSRPKKLRDELISARIDQVHGREASTYQPRKDNTLA